MLHDPDRPGAQIIPFPKSRVSACLTPAERAELYAWEDARAASGFVQVTIDRDDWAGVDFALIYCLSQQWSIRVTLRAGRRLALWDCEHGHCLGEYATIREALSEIPERVPSIVKQGLVRIGLTRP
jgi:hypothetical protein